MKQRRRILFVAEDVTLAQVVRLVTLAKSLEEERYEVHFASSQFPDFIFSDAAFTQHRIETLNADKASRLLRAGKRLYEKSTLLKYIAAEVALIDRVQPDLVVGDFRLSLSTSAELCRVPSAVLINAYWSPYAVRSGFPVPDHPIIKILGERLTEEYFPRAIPKVFAHFASPLNAARRKHGLAPVGSLLQMLTHGDHTLYPDVEALTPLHNAPANHHFLGPVLWEPECEKPQLPWSDKGKPLLYVTLGSSGKAELMPTILEAIGQLPVHAVVATAGRTTAAQVPANIMAQDFVPGSWMAKQADLVVCNGGSSTGYQALCEGTPVLGIPTNFDQFLSMQALLQYGAATQLKARQTTVETVRAAILDALATPQLKQNAAQLSSVFARSSAALNFNRWLDSVLPSAAPPRAAE